MSAAEHEMEIERLRKEKADRDAVDSALMRAAIERIDRHLQKLRDESATKTSVLDMESRVRKIEIGWGKLLGTCLAIQLFGGGLIAVLTLLKR